MRYVLLQEPKKDDTSVSVPQIHIVKNDTEFRKDLVMKRINEGYTLAGYIESEQPIYMLKRGFNSKVNHSKEKYRDIIFKARKILSPLEVEDD
jgi:hypothetical protein